VDIIVVDDASIFKRKTKSSYHKTPSEFLKLAELIQFFWMTLIEEGICSCW